MFKDNTVFVVGAGASNEFGLPVGSGLVKKIKENCVFDIDQWGQIKNGPAPIFSHYDRLFGRNDPEKVREFNLRLTASRQIRDGIDSADSIDEYIYRYSHDPIVAEVGKLQIAYAISLAEETSSLSGDTGFPNDIERADNTWIWTFVKALINGLKASDTDKIGANITIICFNYDRCIEHYLEYALTRSFHGMSLIEAREIVGRIKIIHPYGSLGQLSEFPFGHAYEFARMAENIITWSETIRDENTVPDMRLAIKTAETIVFLGFGFANQNMQLLNSQPTQLNYSAARVYSTGYLMREETELSLKVNINALKSDGYLEAQLSKIHFQYGSKCKEFFDIHRLNLVK